MRLKSGNATSSSGNFNPRTPYGMRHDWILPSAIIKLFQSTHPLRDATVCYHMDVEGCRFQSTHPLRDATDHIQSELPDHSDFNPRTPYGMRPFYLKKTSIPSGISIHAPLTGCDKKQSILADEGRYFNPRTPYGMRHEDSNSQTVAITISIHAPLTGCDAI